MVFQGGSQHGSMFTEYFMGVSRVFHGSHGSYPSRMSACFMIVHYEIAGWLGTLFGSPPPPPPVLIITQPFPTPSYTSAQDTPTQTTCKYTITHGVCWDMGQLDPHFLNSFLGLVCANISVFIVKKDSII